MVDRTTDLSKGKLRRLKRQIGDATCRFRSLPDAYLKHAIEREELVSLETAIQQRLRRHERRNQWWAAARGRLAKTLHC